MIKPQGIAIQDELNRFSTEFSSSQSQSLAEFSGKLDSFKSEVETKNQELSAFIQGEMDGLKETIELGIAEITSSTNSFDEKYQNIMIDSSTKASEGLIAKSRELNEKTNKVLNEMENAVIQKIGEVSTVIANGIQKAHPLWILSDTVPPSEAGNRNLENC